MIHLIDLIYLCILLLINKFTMNSYKDHTTIERILTIVLGENKTKCIKRGCYFYSSKKCRVINHIKTWHPEIIDTLFSANLGELVQQTKSNIHIPIHFYDSIENLQFSQVQTQLENENQYNIGFLFNLSKIFCDSNFSYHQVSKKIGRFQELYFGKQLMNSPSFSTILRAVNSLNNSLFNLIYEYNICSYYRYIDESQEKIFLFYALIYELTNINPIDTRINEINASKKLSSTQKKELKTLNREKILKMRLMTICGSI